MNATTICEMLASRIESEIVLKARVHSIFKNACNLVTSKYEFITILNFDRKIYPMSVVIEGEDIDFTTLNMVPGTEFTLSKGSICCGKKDLFIDVSKAKKWKSEPDLDFTHVSYEELEKNIVNLEEGLNLYGRFDCTAPLVMSLKNADIKLNCNEVLDIKYEFIQHRFSKFIELILENNLNEIPDSAKKLIGFGIGLTPSLDDFISGIMVSLIYLSKFYNYDTNEAYILNSGIISCGLTGTTRVSSEMLKFSSVGKTSLLMKNLILSLLCETDHYKIMQKVKEAIEVGETSGTDTILGIYTGFKIVKKIKFKAKEDGIWKMEIIM